MKKVFSLLLTILILSLCTISAGAKTTFSEGEWVYSAIKDGSYLEIDEYTGEGGDIIIPRIVKDRMVTSIASHCFLNNNTVKSVETSSPLWTVSDYAFLNCTSLEKFTCNFALKEIGVGAFLGTSALKSIDLENSVVTVIRPHAFMSSAIESVILPETCTEIMHDAFSQSGLKEITIPYTVTNIGDDAFKGCTNLTIKGHLNSYAQKYAKENGFTFEPLDTLYGDANGDGKVNILDVTAIQKYKIGEQDLSDYGIKCADVNHDGSVTIRDATLIQMKLAKYDVDF